MATVLYIRKSDPAIFSMDKKLEKKSVRWNYIIHADIITV